MQADTLGPTMGQVTALLGIVQVVFNKTWNRRVSTHTFTHMYSTTVVLRDQCVYGIVSQLTHVAAGSALFTHGYTGYPSLGL